MTTAKQGFDLKERHADYLADFTHLLTQHRFWHVLPEGETSVGKSTGLFDSDTGLLYPTAEVLSQFLAKHPFVFLNTGADNETLATLDSSTRLLWHNEPLASADTPKTNSGNFASLAGVLKLAIAQQHAHSTGKSIAQQGNWAGLENWALPLKEELKAFASQGNPHLSSQGDGLVTAESKVSQVWLTATGSCNLSGGTFTVTPGGYGALFAINHRWERSSPKKILTDLCKRGWILVAPNGESFQPDTRWIGLSLERLQAALAKARVHLCSPDQSILELNPSTVGVNTFLAELDYTPCRLPKLDLTQLTDPGKGLWELWDEAPDVVCQYGLVARDPGQDVQRRAVAIDFGTSSTVVAMDTASGGRELLRIGVRSFYREVQPQHFENPTVLECLDFSAFESAWTQRAYRPELDWNWMRAAHEAQASFRDNPGDTQILASILPRLKQWALRSERSQVRLTDRKQREIELAAHTERNPVRGQALSVGADYPFDPIELYAWYLGMAINWRGRGLFLKYYLSFPVKYEREVKDRILASFRRGLQRSLPQTLIDHHPQVLNDFEVNDLASEPAAYAAAALPKLEVSPTDEGVPYAVFDFGGGTTDFDFGLLRWATADEEEHGYERVFEHLASSGDNFLGGENLLEHMVYQTFIGNLDELRKHRIQFTQPIDAVPFAGSEAFLAPTQAAQTNTVMLTAKLRPFLESESPNLPNQIKLELIDSSGSKKPCELALDADALDALLLRRIRNGAEAFMAELALIKPELPQGAPIHLMLAGNGSRSRHIQALFDSQGSLWPELLSQAFGSESPNIVVHPPLPMDDGDPHAPTAKTGVALGLLRLVPGENTLLINHLHSQNSGQAPFGWFVGKMRRGQFEPVLVPGTAYGEWHNLGPLQQGVFNLYLSASPRSRLGLAEGDPELSKIRRDFPAAPAGARLYACAVGPHRLSLLAALEPPVSNVTPDAYLDLG